MAFYSQGKPLCVICRIAARKNGMELDSELFSAQKRNGKRFPIRHFLNSGAEGDDAFQLSKKTITSKKFSYLIERII
jgi:hypothetical protein